MWHDIEQKNGSANNELEKNKEYCLPLHDIERWFVNSTGKSSESFSGNFINQAINKTALFSQHYDYIASCATSYMENKSPCLKNSCVLVL